MCCMDLAVRAAHRYAGISRALTGFILSVAHLPWGSAQAAGHFQQSCQQADFPWACVALAKMCYLKPK